MSARILVTSMVSLALSAGVSAYAQDSDADRVRDPQDGFPCDASAVGETFAPGQGVHGLLIFEDKWPLRADTDFNDLVISYNYAVKTNATGLATSIRATFNVLAFGGVYDSGLSLHLPVPAQSVASATLEVPGGAPVQLMLSTLDTEFTVDLSNNLREFFADQAGQINSLSTLPRMGEATLVVQVNLSSPTTLAMGEAPFDLFTFRSDDRGHEIHGPSYAGSALMQTTLFGTGDDGSTPNRHFVDVSGLPFRLELPVNALYPAEGEAISSLFPAIVNFAASGGTLDQDFYQSQVVTTFAYTDSQGLGAPSPVFIGSDAHSVNTACVGAYIPSDVAGCADGTVERADADFGRTDIVFCQTPGNPSLPTLISANAVNECAAGTHVCTSAEFTMRNDSLGEHVIAATLDDGNNCFATGATGGANVFDARLDNVRSGFAGSCTGALSSTNWGRQELPACADFSNKCGVLCCR